MHNAHKYICVFPVAMLKAMFSTSFSDPSEPSRAKEEESYIYFGDFLDSCEGICC